jgi:hypothetical protein
MCPSVTVGEGNLGRVSFTSSLMIALMPNLCKNLSSDFASDGRRIFPGGDNAGHVTNYNVKRIPGGFALTLLYPLLPHRRCRSCMQLHNAEFGDSSSNPEPEPSHPRDRIHVNRSRRCRRLAALEP